MAAAQPVADFYRGKTVTMVIGYPPAGANNVYARMVARHIGRHIPGNPNVVPRNMPGAGSLIAANHIFNVAPKDGTVLGLLVPTLPLEEVLGATAVKFKSAGFHWIGRMAPAPNITFINATSPVKAITDAFDKTHESGIALEPGPHQCGRAQNGDHGGRGRQRADNRTSRDQRSGLRRHGRFGPEH